MPRPEDIEEFDRASTRKDERPLLAIRCFKRTFNSSGEGDIACERGFKRITTNRNEGHTPLQREDFKSMDSRRDEEDIPCESSVLEHHRQKG